MSNSDTLKDIGILADLTDDERETVAKSCVWKTYASHEQIIDQDSDSRDIFFVVSGRVRVVIYSLSGREITFNDLDAGGHFGELAAIDGDPRSASVMALAESRVASLNPDQFVAIMSEHPNIALKLMRHLVQMVRSATSRIMELSTLGANNRVHAELLRQARSLSEDGNSATITPIPVHGEIASRVSTTRETVARVLNDLVRKGVLERTKDSLLIKDLSRLRDMVDEVRGE